MRPLEDQIPPRYTVLPYYVTGAIALAVWTLMLVISAPAFTGHFFQPKLLAITHLVALGWGTMIIMGASNQLAPVIAGRALYSRRLTAVILILKTSGICLLTASFWNFDFSYPIYLGAGLLLLAFLLHAINIWKTFNGAPGSVISDLIQTAHVWLIVTGSAGFLISIHLRYPFLPEDHLSYLKLHASLGMAGWFLQLVIGVSARLLPMFLLSRNEDTRHLNKTYYCLNAALVLFFIEGFARGSSVGKPLYVALVVAGLTFYFGYVHQCYKTAMRKRLDPAMKQTFLALLLMSVPFVLLLLAVSFDGRSSIRLVTAYGFAYFGGFLTVMIMAQTFKTLPFIVWMHITKPDEIPTIMPKDLFYESWVRGQILVYFLGFLVFLGGILLHLLPFLYTGSLLMLISALWYCGHVFLIIRKIPLK